MGDKPSNAAARRVDAAMRGIADLLGLREPAREITDETVLSMPRTGAELRRLVARVVEIADRTNPAIVSLRVALHEVVVDAEPERSVHTHSADTGFVDVGVLDLLPSSG